MNLRFKCCKCNRLVDNRSGYQQHKDNLPGFFWFYCCNSSYHWELNNNVLIPKLLYLNQDENNDDFYFRIKVVYKNSLFEIECSKYFSDGFVTYNKHLFNVTCDQSFITMYDLYDIYTKYIDNLEFL